MEPLTDFHYLVAVNYQTTTTNDLKNLFVINTLGRGPKEITTFVQRQNNRMWECPAPNSEGTEGMLPSADFPREGSKDLYTTTQQAASLPLPIPANSVTSPARGQAPRKGTGQAHLQSTHRVMTWFPHSRVAKLPRATHKHSLFLTPCKCQRPSVNPAVLLLLCCPREDLKELSPMGSQGIKQHQATPHTIKVSSQEVTE